MRMRYVRIVLVLGDNETYPRETSRPYKEILTYFFDLFILDVLIHSHE